MDSKIPFPRAYVDGNTQVFTYDDAPIRVVMIDGEPWWVAADACKVLEITWTKDATARLDEDEKGRVSIPTLGGQQEMTIVNEPGLYSLILGSRKPEAKAFRRWITHDVIPQIRKTGAYSADAISIEDLIIMQAQRMKEVWAGIERIDQRGMEHEKRLDGICNVVALNPVEWRKETGEMINRIAEVMGGTVHIHAIRRESYELLDGRFHVDLKRRLQNKRRRMAEEGASKSAINKTNYLDVIGEDCKLIEGYVSIIKDLTIRHGAC